MVELSVKLAGYSVRVNALYDRVREYCKDYLCDSPHDFSVTISREDILFERQKAEQEAALEGLPVRDYADAMLEVTAVQRKIAERLFERDILVFHGSVIAVDGIGYLFTAKSGTGKSTHTRLWREVFGQRAVMVNDDKPFLKITEDGVTAYGSPWMGKHGLGNNIHVPLKAICILERGEENRAVQISPVQALTMLMQQSQRPRSAVNLPRYMELIDRLSSKVIFYRMQCNMDPEAARVAYEAMASELN